METELIPTQYQKEFNKIADLSPFQVVARILKHYDCPPTCGAACCKNLSIPVTYQESLKIGKNSRVNRRILNTLVYPTGKYEAFKDVGYDEKVNGTFKIFPSKPCPFLRGDKCSVQKMKPLSCKIYPINIMKKAEGQDGLNFRVNLCELGFNLYLDYVPFLYQTTLNNPYSALDNDTLQTIADNMRQNENFLIERAQAQKTDFDDMGFIVIQEIELLRMFLLWLNVLGDEATKERENFRSILLGRN